MLHVTFSYDIERNKVRQGKNIKVSGKIYDLFNENRNI